MRHEFHEADTASPVSCEVCGRSHHLLGIEILLVTDTDRTVGNSCVECYAKGEQALQEALIRRAGKALAMARWFNEEAEEFLSAASEELEGSPSLEELEAFENLANE